MGEILRCSTYVALSYLCCDVADFKRPISADGITEFRGGYRQRRGRVRQCRGPV
jgi:hypothetical protein